MNLYGESHLSRQSALSLMEALPGAGVIFQGDLPDTPIEWAILKLTEGSLTIAETEIFSEDQVDRMVSLASGKNARPICIISRANMVDRYPKLAAVMQAIPLKGFQH